MSLNRRFAFVLAGLLAGLALLWLGIYRQESRWQQLTAAEAQNEKLGLLRHWMQAESTTLLHATRALGEHPAVANLPTDPSSAAPVLAPLTWLLAANGSVLAGPESPATPPDLPWQDAGFRARLDREGAVLGHIRLAGGVHEACLVRTGGSEDHDTVRLVLRLRPWHPTRLAQLGSLADAKLQLIENPDNAVAPSLLPLRDWQGRPVAWLAAEFNVRENLASLAPPAVSTLWFIAFGLLVVTAVALGLRRWVLHPLATITTSLGSGESAPAMELTRDPGEMGALARLVQTSFAQRAELQSRELELQRILDERTRLGRDLHDGIIQSLYATGMGLAGIKAQLRPDQTEVAAALEQSRAALNGTILDLRNFITGLEPESLKQQSFGQAVATLLENACHARPAQIECTVDDALAAHLTISQRANILQITREAVSNALRHGVASVIRVTLHAEGAATVFAIEDNGRGFDPAAGNGHGGHGLHNLAKRAAEIGAQFSLASHPGQGTRLRLTLHPNKAATP